MKYAVQVTALVIMCASIGAVNAQYDAYIWQAYRPDAISADAAAIVLEIRSRVEEILAAGNHLRPARQYFADITTDGWWIYFEPGRIISTMAAAFPYLTPQQQARVREYVRDEIADTRFAPWSSADVMPVEGAPQRQHYTMSKPWMWERYWGMAGQAQPRPLRMAVLYGLWRYACASGDWDIIADNWGAIKDVYSGNASGGDMYGSMSGHIAMARMAARRGDNGMTSQALTNAQNALNAGRSFAVVDAAMATYLPSRYYEERHSWGVYHGFMFCNMAPEIGRFIRDGTANLANAVRLRHEEGKSKFPHWWLYRCPVFCRWTGDEGVGLPSEIIGMMFPVERWMSSSDYNALRGYMIHTAQQGIGDCYVMEAAVMTVDAHGREKWQDVRAPRFLGPAIVVAGRDSAVQFVPLVDNPGGANVSITYPSKPLWLAESGDGLSGTAPSDDATGTIRAVMHAGGVAVDTLNATVVVTDPMEPPQSATRTSGVRTVEGTNSINLRIMSARSGRTVFIVQSQSGGPASITLSDLRGALVWKRECVLTAGKKTALSMPGISSGSYIVGISHCGFAFKRALTCVR